MKLLFLPLLLVLAPLVGRAQQPTADSVLTLGSATFPRGVYLSKTELAQRDPSYLGPYTLAYVDATADYNARGKRGQAELSKVGSLTDKQIRKTVVAFCTGKALFINCITGNHALGFRQVLNKGPLWYMVAPDPQSGLGGSGISVGMGVGMGIGLGGISAGSGGMNNSGPPRYQGIVYNDQTFRFYQLNRATMRELLTSNLDLLARFDKEDKPRDADARLALYRRYVDDLNASLSPISEDTKVKTP